MDRCDVEDHEDAYENFYVIDVTQNGQHPYQKSLYRLGNVHLYLAANPAMKTQYHFIRHEGGSIRPPRPKTGLPCSTSLNLLIWSNLRFPALYFLLGEDRR